MKMFKQTKRALLLSVFMLVVCLGMLIGTTYAWFTDSASSGGNIIQAGNLDVKLEYKTKWSDTWQEVNENSEIFNVNALYEPGYTEVVYFRVSNAGTLNFKYNFLVDILKEQKSTNKNGEEFKLSDYLQLGTYIQDEFEYGFNYADILMPIMFGTRANALANVTEIGKLSDKAGIIYNDRPILVGNQTAQVIALVLTLPETIENEINKANDAPVAKIELGVRVLATQYQGEKDSFGDDYDKDAEYPTMVDTWDGTADISWFFENPTATEYTLDSAEDLAGLAALVDGTAPIPADSEITLPGDFDFTFAGKTFTLNSDVDLYALDENGNRILFEPIGDASNADFSGVFDGNGKTIYNLRQDCNSKHLALFGAVYEGTVKNLTIDGALIENNGDGYAGIIAAYAGASTFENITLRNSTVVNYNHNTGGIVAWCSNNGTTTTFDGINIESTTTIGSWWGSYDTRVGGVVGAMNTGNNIVIKNSTIACKLDVYNDVTSNYQWYNYRTAGMVVADVRDTVTVDGRTQANPARVTCENVTVIFGDWAQYHYCESASYGKPSYADEGEYKFRRVEPGLGYSGIDLNDCNHAADETHNELIEFTFLFGARDGKGIYGISEFEGVTVIKNNK